MKILARGAEAIILESKDNLLKKRIAKGYRIPQLDEKLRKLRTRSEAKLLDKANKIISAPKLIEFSEKNKELVIENIKGKRLAQFLEKLEYNKISKELGETIAKLHNANIIHGDLTTSNMILSEKNNLVYLIDFGLGFHSARAEDKAVDLHVLKEALEAKHPTIADSFWKGLVRSYKKASKNPEEILKRLQKVESRGRYKTQY